MGKMLLLGSMADLVGGVVQSPAENANVVVSATATLQISTEVKAMKNSIGGTRNWWAASLLGEPVDGSSN